MRTKISFFLVVILLSFLASCGQKSPEKPLSPEIPSPEISPEQTPTSTTIEKTPSRSENTETEKIQKNTSIPLPGKFVDENGNEIPVRDLSNEEKKQLDTLINEEFKKLRNK